MVLDSIDVGGTETHVASLAEEMVQKGIGVVIVSRGGALIDRFKRIGCPIYQVNFPFTLNIPPEQQSYLTQQIKKIIIDEKISLVHAHQTPSAYLSFQPAKALGIPTVFTVHGTYYSNAELVKVLQISSKIVCVSPPIQKFVQQITSNPSVVIANGIDTNEYSPVDASQLRSKLGIPEGAPVLLYSSRLAWTKANVCMTFLRACKDLRITTHPNLHVVVVGGGPRSKEIQDITNTIHRTTIDKFIHLTGEMYDDLQRYYSLADCVVGTGRVALEAMACSKPVIAVGSHGYFGIVSSENYEKAWHCYFGDHGSNQPVSRYTIAGDVRKLFSSQEELKEAGQQSREWMLDTFNIKHRVANLLELYGDLLGGKL